jgi:NADPH:quinone reductase-like Zn-dependent oxidoreductase
MKTLTYPCNGEPWEVIAITEQPVPVPAAGEVLVRLEAMPLHIADLMAIRGELGLMPKKAGIAGFEGVGRVVTGVPGWPEGTRVLLPIAHGAAREFQAHDPAVLMRVPDGPAAAQLALVRINLTTAWTLLHAFEALPAGSWVVQNAANSNVAGYVEALARRAGLKVLNLVRRPELVVALGRPHVQLDNDDISLPGERPLLALDAVGGAATARLGRLVADKGLVLSYGFLSKAPHAIDYPDLIYRGVRLQGMLTNHPLERMDAAAHARMNAELEAFVASDDLNAEIAGIYPFARAADALRHAACTGAERAGKVILTPQ